MDAVRNVFRTDASATSANQKARLSAAFRAQEFHSTTPPCLPPHNRSLFFYITRAYRIGNMEDDDELYEPEEGSPNDTSNESLEPAHAKEVKMADRLEEGEEDDDDEEEDEEEDSESVRIPPCILRSSNC
jgi:hypothetical protein